MIGCMRELVLDGSEWKTKDDVYNAFFRAVGAPEWHGRNLDALADSISGGSINQVEVPYRLVIKDYNRIGPLAKGMTGLFSGTDKLGAKAQEYLQLEVCLV